MARLEDRTFEHPEVTPADKSTRPMIELSESGLLWLINRQVFHPRGISLCLEVTQRDRQTVRGWTLDGDGRKVHVFSEESDDRYFAAAQFTIARHLERANRR